MIYDFIHADTAFLNIEDGKRSKITELNLTNNAEGTRSLAGDMAREISAVLAKHNIKTNDLAEHQFMSSRDDGSGNFTLYLIDTEGYHMA